MSCPVPSCFKCQYINKKVQASQRTFEFFFTGHILNKEHQHIQDLSGVAMLPAVLNIFSELVLVTQGSGLY